MTKDVGAFTVCAWCKETLARLKFLWICLTLTLILCSALLEWYSVSYILGKSSRGLSSIHSSPIALALRVLMRISFKTRRERQREPRQTNRLMSKPVAVHGHYNPWYISLPSSAKLELEMTKFCVVWRTWTATYNFSYFYLELNAFVAYSPGASFNTDKHTG